MKDEPCINGSSFLLGHPFLKIARTKIDVFNGTLTMEFDGEIIKFNIYDVMRYPSDVSSIFNFDCIDTFMERVFYTSDNGDALQVMLENHLYTESFKNTLSFNSNIEDMVIELDSFSLNLCNFSFMDLSTSQFNIPPSLERAPIFELKPLLNHLKYVYLGEKDTLLMVIYTKLKSLEEELNMQYDDAGKERKLDIQESEEICNDAYKSARIYKDKTRYLMTDISLGRLHVGHKVLLFQSHLRLMRGQLRCRWIPRRSLK
ncbi:hypothetical protein Scep_012229 [Stephania cephalantha]|uniref:Uncharacterized protein n=1 Tax=Stephania cephalantha TaxID=152367 RepID=A0AAP0P9N6_9MAGN